MASLVTSMGAVLVAARAVYTAAFRKNRSVNDKRHSFDTEYSVQKNARLVLAVDCGTESLRVGLYCGQTGKLYKSHNASYPTIAPRSGYT
eukprot:1317933-Amorphochlora_amoeboformis.AAC.1